MIVDSANEKGGFESNREPVLYIPNLWRCWPGYLVTIHPATTHLDMTFKSE